jgi:hypothetical protein
MLQQGSPCTSFSVSARLAFALHSPFSILGSLATLLIWQRRGAVASATPYKVTFLGYAIICLMNLPCALNEVEAPEQANVTDCGFPLLRGDTISTALMSNSTFLAIFRF